MPLQRCQQETTSSEFVDWLRYIAQEEMDRIKRHEKLDFYLAQIASEVCKSQLTKASRAKIKMSDFLLNIKTEKPEKSEQKESLKNRTQRVKGFFRGWLSGGKG